MVSVVFAASILAGGQVTREVALPRARAAMKVLSGIDAQKSHIIEQPDGRLRIKSGVISMSFYPSGTVNMFSTMRNAAEKSYRGTPRINGEEAAQLVKLLHSKLKLQPYPKSSVTFRPILIDKGLSLDVFAGCYFVRMTKAPQGIDASTNGSFAEYVIEGSSKRVLLVFNSEKNEKYWGTKGSDRRVGDQVLLAIARQKGLRASKVVQGQLTWIPAKQIPSFAKNVKGLDLQRDLILTRSYVVQNLVVWTDPETGNVQGTEQRPLGLESVGHLRGQGKQ